MRLLEAYEARCMKPTSPYLSLSPLLLLSAVLSAVLAPLLQQQQQHIGWCWRRGRQQQLQLS